MNPVRHPTNNMHLQRPDGMTEDECSPLPVTQGVQPDGMTALMSFWQPTDEERAAIANGAQVRMTLLGRSHPPVKLSVAHESDPL